LLSRLPPDDPAPSRIVKLDLRAFDSWHSVDPFLQGFAAAIVARLGLPEAVLAAAWDRPSNPVGKLNWLMGRHVLPAAAERFVLVIDNADAVCAAAFQDDFFSLLRAWVEQSSHEPWSRLRLVLALSTSPALLRTTTASSPFNLVPPIKLDDFDAARVRALAERHGLDWTVEDALDLMSLVGGHPYLVRLAMYRAAPHRMRPSELFADEESGTETFGPHLQEQLARLREEPALLDAVGRVLADPSTHLHPETYRRLNSIGLIVQEANEYRLRYPLYAAFLRARV
jgi:AAA-like domain